MRNDKVKYLTENEVQRVFDEIGSVRDLAMFSVCYYRGLRASELRTIRRRDINLDERTIEIERLKGSFGGRYDLAGPELEALDAWLSDRACNQHPDGHIFPISRVQIFNLFQKYAKAAGIHSLKRHPHVLKHSIATHLLDRGLTITDVQDWLGHRDLQNTMIYAKVTNGRRREAAKQAFGERADLSSV